LRHSHLWINSRVLDALGLYLAASGRSDTAPTPPGLGASHAFRISPAFGCSRYQPIALPSGPRHLRGEADDQGIRHRTCWITARWARAGVRGGWPSRKTVHGGGAACQRRVPGPIGRRWHAIRRSREYRQSRGCRPKWCRPIASHSPALGLAGELRDGGGVAGEGHCRWLGAGFSRPGALPWAKGFAALATSVLSLTGDSEI
jgi:hypothetical protein